MVAISN